MIRKLRRTLAATMANLVQKFIEDLSNNVQQSLLDTPFLEYDSARVRRRQPLAREGSIASRPSAGALLQDYA